jgi:heme/copper-type cytochrome/quinol oxidase subunit 2
MNRSSAITAALAITAIIVASALGYYFGVITVAPKGASSVVSTVTTTQLSVHNSTVTSNATVTTGVTTTVQNNSLPFVLTLVITTNNFYNSTYNPQPAYYVLTPNGLQSSANIALPAHKLIKLVIVNYDDGAAPLLMKDAANVSGTQGNLETVVNNDNVNSSQGLSGINVNGGQQVSSVNSSNIAHTFTIPSIGVNLPIPPSSTVSAYFTLNDTGTLTWLCLTACGFGPMGTLGAMDTMGWMTGSIDVS